MNLQNTISRLWGGLGSGGRTLVGSTAVFGVIIGGFVGLSAALQEPAPSEPVVVIDRAQFAEFKDENYVSKAITSVIGCPPGTPTGVYNKVLNAAIEADGNLVVLDVNYQADVKGHECYRGVAYKFS